MGDRLKRALNFNPETGEIEDIIEVQYVEGSGFRAIIEIGKILPNRGIAFSKKLIARNWDTLEDWEDFCLRNIPRFGIEGLMSEVPVSFQV